MKTRRWISVVARKGGVGKTTCALGLAARQAVGLEGNAVPSTKGLL